MTNNQDIESRLIRTCKVWEVLATLRWKANKEAMSQLTPNPLQEVNLPAKPHVHNGAQDRYWVLEGLGVFHWKRKKSMQRTIIYFNSEGKKNQI